MSQIQIKNLTFCYEGSYDNIFERVSFQIDTDWKLGFIGRNGRGKTTFLKLLLGEYEYEGSIISPEVFDYFPFSIQDQNRDTLEVLEGIDSDFELWRVCRELTELSIDCEILYRPFHTLSNGERTKVLLALMFSRENHFLLIDEPTNHLDMEGRQNLMEYLRKKEGFILVSHDRHFLDHCVNHILSINRNNIEVTQGNFSSWWENKQRQDAFELAENEKLKKEMNRLSAAAKRTERWSNQVEKTKYHTLSSGIKPDVGYIGHKSAKMMKRAKSIEGRMTAAAEEKKKLLKNIERSDDIKLVPLRHHKEVLIYGENLTVQYGGDSIFMPLNFSVSRGQRVVLNGKNGCGKTSLLKTILRRASDERKAEKDAKRSMDGVANGRIESTSTGILHVASGLIISYVSQNTSFLRGSLKDYARMEGLDESLFKAILRQLDFSRIQFEKNMADFSEGQKKKVLIAKSLSQRAHLYIWDEPLNFIDLFSRIQIEHLILQYQPTLLFVEHDRSFCENVATHEIQMMKA